MSRAKGPYKITAQTAQFSPQLLMGQRSVLPVIYQFIAPENRELAKRAAHPDIEKPLLEKSETIKQAYQVLLAKLRARGNQTDLPRRSDLVALVQALIKKRISKPEFENFLAANPELNNFAKHTTQRTEITRRWNALVETLQEVLGDQVLLQPTVIEHPAAAGVLLSDLHKPKS